ncbi:hypothetical protein [Pseudomonas sp. MN1F]|uniref:hypothetical protein n=1 Tax=Pseudomonas sp. MN1F TaxID=1366632 RepID=UPI0015B71F4D|nr:hypothetical protein [Pseudomonas sp. MN1F]
MVLRDMKPVMAWGVAAIVGPLLMIFGIHWWGNALASEKAEFANYRNTTSQAVLSNTRAAFGF